ncbi:MAG: NrdH-redoxin, partial [Rhodocyclaceae bacterium]|nr:NrdH-redoxin [Rhodocyclaceae bacterium]
MEFDIIDIFNDPAGLAELTALGAKTTPVVARGDQWVLGQVIPEVAKFLGL